MRQVSQTPIYDQLRGERINADVPASDADPQPARQPGECRYPAGGSDPAAVLASPEARADLGASGSWFAVVDPAVTECPGSRLAEAGYSTPDWLAPGEAGAELVAP